MKKRLMLLGGIRYLLPVIEAAHKLGYYVITADYIPDNIAHRFSDEYVNVSIIDKEAVLKVAREKKIDGIMSFGVDPGVISAAYVQEQMGLPAFGPFESVVILQNKDLFRAFLKKHHFNVPEAKGYKSIDEALADRDRWEYPVIVKPTDSAGSKGVSIVSIPDELEFALKNALSYSFSGHIIVEQFIEQEGCSSDCDCFSIDGVLSFVSFSAQRFDRNAPNPFTPAAYSWPSTFTDAQQFYFKQEIQRLLSLLNLGTSIYNVETRIGKDGLPYIMECSPRGGGNRLAEMVRYITGVDLIEASVSAAVGGAVGRIEQAAFEGSWAEIIVHSNHDGIFQGLDISERWKDYLVEADLWVKSGDMVTEFKGANDAFGTLVMRFNDNSEVLQVLDTCHEWLKLQIEC